MRGATKPSTITCSIDPFQSTHPLRGATQDLRALRRHDDDFNPRTPCGVRLAHIAALPSASIYFNPRTPCGVRLVLGLVLCILSRISIHAPLAGCDKRKRGLMFHFTNFNPRTPCGVRRFIFVLFILIKRRFQSTHPLRGATTENINNKGNHSISIHAPLAGCDNVRLSRLFACVNFNPRTPCGVRPPCKSNTTASTGFQSTHPLRGATGAGRGRVPAGHHFNPRTPCGVRLGKGGTE